MIGLATTLAPTAFIFGSGYEWLIVLVVCLLLFGHRIPGMARSLGSGIVEFKKGLRGEDSDSEKIESSSQSSEKGD